MACLSSDSIISVYHSEVPLEIGYLNELQAALLEPQSEELRTILNNMVEVQASELGKVPEGLSLKARALERSPHLFLSEALERSAVASSICRRLRDTDLASRIFHMTWHVCEMCASVYRTIPGRFSPEDMDRILRTRTLATEDGGASTIFWQGATYIAEAFSVEANVKEQPERAALYSNLVKRLEKAESATRGNSTRLSEANSLPKPVRKLGVIAARKASRHFREADYDVLAQIRLSLGLTEAGPAEIYKSQRDQELARRREKILEGISKIWRENFVYLLDFKDIGNGGFNRLKSNPKVVALAGFDEVERGRILTDLARLRHEVPDWSSSGKSNPHRLDSISRRGGGQGADSVGFFMWSKLEAVADVVLHNIVKLDDADMALVIRAAQDWRPLCKFELLDSAERTLEASSAPLTLSALGSLIDRPSHGILPGNAGPNFDGDIWWNGAPPRARELISRFAERS